MAIIKKYSPFQNIGSYDVFIDDGDIDSPYFNVTELEKTLTGGKNAFLFEGSPFFKKGTKIRFEALDVNGETLYIEPGVQAGKTFKDGTSIVMAIHIYDDTPIGIGSLQIAAELQTYIDDNGVEKDIPEEYRDRPNIRWTQTFKVNPKIPNKTQVRFFKRPTFSVTEIEKPLIIKDNMSLSKSGSIIGIPDTPDTGSDFSTWTAPSQYRIKLQEGNKFTQSMDENTTLVVSNLGYSSSVLEVLNEDEILVRKPYLIDNKVNAFSPVSYSLDFESVEDASVDSGSNITASYAEIRLENLATFTGDVARIKIFRKSRNDLGDFQVVQENKLDSTELLRDFTVPKRTVINYGKLRKENIVSDVGDVYYTTSSGVKIHNQHLINSLLVSSSHTVESNGTIGEFEIVSGSEYSLTYKSRFIGLGDTSQSFADANTLEFLLVTSSNNTTNTLVTTQSIDIQTGSKEIGPPVGIKFKTGFGLQDFDTQHNGCGVGNQQNVTKNFFAEINGKCQIRIKADTQVNGENNFPTGSFVFGTLSLKNAEESSYSPDEYTAVVDIPRKNPTEQFDFRVEFYDINNNFIPIKVEQSVPFRKGNTSRILSTAVNVSASGVSDAGDILSVNSGVVQIANTNIQTSVISNIEGFGNPTAFSQSVDTTTTTLNTQTTDLAVSSSEFASSTDSLNNFTESFNTAISLNSDDVTIKGDLTVQGTSTALDTTTLNVKDLNILVASGAADSNAADGAGLTIDGANESLTWNHSDSRFQFSDDLHITGNLTLSGDLPILTELNSFTASRNSKITIDGTTITFSDGAGTAYGKFTSDNGLQVGDNGTANLYLGNTITPSSADKGARFHSDNNDFFFDFQGDATQHFFLRDYDGSGGIHNRFTFDFINGHISSSGGLYSADIINSAGNVMIGGNLSVTGSIGYPTAGALGNYPGRVKLSGSLNQHSVLLNGSPDGVANTRTYVVDLREGSFFTCKLDGAGGMTHILEITSSNEGQTAYILMENDASGVPVTFQNFHSSVFTPSGSMLQPSVGAGKKDLFKVVTFNSGSLPFVVFLNREMGDLGPV